MLSLVPLSSGYNRPFSREVKFGDAVLNLIYEIAYLYKRQNDKIVHICIFIVLMIITVIIVERFLSNGGSFVGKTSLQLSL